jgi:ATP-dependent Clp protease adaptor protein ClpS
MKDFWSNRRVTFNSSAVICVEAQEKPRIEEATAEQISEEPPYRVIIHNDDVTPMNFVMAILMTVFFLDNIHALQVMYTAHYHGRAYVQSLPRPEAIQRVGRAHVTSQLNGYPLRFSIEKQ